MTTYQILDALSKSPITVSSHRRDENTLYVYTNLGELDNVQVAFLAKLRIYPPRSTLDVYSLGLTGSKCFYNQYKCC